MGKNIIESVFTSKKILNDFYPQFPGVKTFDLQKKHLLYGRIDKQGDAIYLDDSNLRQVVGANNSTHLAIDFVEAAFSDMRKNIRSASNKGIISKDSLYPSDLKAHKSWTTGDLEFSYDTYLNKIYTTFVNSYLSVDRRADKIKNQKDFIKDFVAFALRTARLFPLTKTGFLTSGHCSSFVSGLMLEITNESHDIEQGVRVHDYIRDRNFTFFVNEVKKFGFMVDKNAPWRVVFNVASGMEDKVSGGELKGGQFYMDRFATSFDGVFRSYFRKAYLDEYKNLSNKLYSLYKAFYIQYNTYTADKYIKCSKNQDSYDLRVLSERKERERPGAIIFASQREEEEYWLKIILKLRMSETDVVHTPQDFDFYANEAVKRSRLFGLDAGLSHANELTKGHDVTMFLAKGKYWYGVSDQEYQQRKLEAMKTAINPSTVDYSITGTKNIR